MPLPIHMDCKCATCRALGFHPAPSIHEVCESLATKAIRRPIRLADLLDKADTLRKQEKGE